ncbi:MAG: aconitase X swivel domain-containing protein [Nitrososphaera sp.]
MIPNCHRIVGGIGEGPALVTSQPINFLAMVDAESGRITDPRHELHGKSIKGSVLVFPYSIGSSVGAYAIYSLKEHGNAPSAIICSKADITTASGCAIAGIPVVNLPTGTRLSLINQGEMTRVDASSEFAKVKV